MEDLIMKYGVALGKRYTLKQRQRFLLTLNDEFSALGYQTRFANNAKKRNARAVNLFIGDLAKADIVICTHHDTPQKVFWPNFRYYPLNGKRNFTNLTLITFIPAVFSSLIGALTIYYLINNLALGGYWYQILLFVVVALSFVFASLLTIGVSNKYNLNRNTASVTVLLETAKNLSKKAKNKVAFILLDKACSNNSGTQMLHQALPKTLDRKLFVYLDCVGNGDNLVVAYKEHLRKECQKLIRNFKGTQTASIVELDEAETVYTPAFFLRRSIVITNGKFDKKHNLYVDKVNSNKDRYVDIPTLEALVAMLTKSFDQ